MPELLARVQSLQVKIFPHARVVVNERTGTVVIGGNVRLQPVSILHGGLQIDVESHLMFPNPIPWERGQRKSCNNPGAGE